jgi:hypothetical protein
VLAVAIHYHITIATPIFWINPCRNRPMKCGIRPIAHLFDQTMLQGIHVDIIDVSLIIVVIPNQMFPKMPLPNASFARCLPHGGAGFGFGQGAGKGAFN